MNLTDTHTHIYYKEGNELDGQIQRCLDNDTTRLFLPNVNLETVPKVLATAKAYPDHCFPMLGLHPCEVKEDYRHTLNAIEKILQDTKIYAIGEIGLDLYWDKTTLQWQKEAFRIQVDWAKNLRQPIVIHCRNAFDELFELLYELEDDRLFGILHCFTGSYEQAKKAIDLGFYLGIGGVVTFKNAGLDKVVEQVSAKYLVLETDAPYLAPVPYRGKPNESSYLTNIAQKVADLKQISLNELAEKTTQNSKIVFGI
ncbi:TatD DNase family protein [bacterium A37T11]|nr:TatD DNase family protein [bacterium A37T11]